jgi:hypothetical protein
MWAQSEAAFNRRSSGRWEFLRPDGAHMQPSDEERVAELTLPQADAAGLRVMFVASMRSTASAVVHIA